MLSLPLFFLMIRRPPRSTLFPTRRSSDLSAANCASAAWASASSPAEEQPARAAIRANPSRALRATGLSLRSEEHTSELQSQSNLVCRLLLEKKNTYDYVVNYHIML